LKRKEWNIMDKCPRCGRWTLALDIRRKTVSCHDIECNYEKPVNVDEYLENHNVLPKLVASLKLNGYGSAKKAEC
jgi:hypothetical protein